MNGNLVSNVTNYTIITTTITNTGGFISGLVCCIIFIGIGMIAALLGFNSLIKLRPKPIQRKVVVMMSRGGWSGRWFCVCM
jgi:hypothetical protein